MADPNDDLADVTGYVEEGLKPSEDPRVTQITGTAEFGYQSQDNQKRPARRKTD